MNIRIIGGTFDDNGGKPSGLISKLADSFESQGATINVSNGGSFDELSALMSNIQEDVIFWMVNVPNDKPKNRDIKLLYPKKYLIMSKRNNDEYTFAEMINRALGQKANLMLEFKATETPFKMRVFDPLGTVWCDYTSDINTITGALIKRLDFIMNITRKPTLKMDETGPVVPNENEFFALIKDYAEIFHELVSPAKEVTRFLGNSSFRCNRGFPSFKHDDYIFVSRRNINKRFIGQEGFVATKLINGQVHYWGEYKPSVDTPIQVRLYDALPNINYMLHSHVYLDDAVFTKTAVPCGAIEEVEEILSVIPDRETDFIKINLIGHGCIVLANNVEQLKKLEYNKRPAPEIL